MQQGSAARPGALRSVARAGYRLAVSINILALLGCAPEVDEGEQLVQLDVRSTCDGPFCTPRCSGDQQCGRPTEYCGRQGFCLPYCVEGSCQPDEVCDFGRCVATSGSACPEGNVTLTPLTPSVMILVDQSDSMSWHFGQLNGEAMSRWQAVRYALSDQQAGVVPRLQRSVRFGASLYTATFKEMIFEGDCLQMTEPADMGGAQMALESGDSIRGLLYGNQPRGTTPTAQAINRIMHKMIENTIRAGQQNDPLVLLLVTDGDPNGCGTFAFADAKRDTELAVRDAFSRGIKTRVLGLGDDLTEEHLQRLANIGMGRHEAPAQEPVFRARSPQELVGELTRVMTDMRSCQFAVNGDVSPHRAPEGEVLLNGNALHWQDQWRLSDPRTIELVGEACRALQTHDNVRVSASFPCGAVIR